MGARGREREIERAVRRCSARVVHSAVLQVCLSSAEKFSLSLSLSLERNLPNGINKINDARSYSSILLDDHSQLVVRQVSSKEGQDSGSRVSKRSR